MKTQDAIKGSELYLRNHGFDSTAVTTMYLPEKIEGISLEQGYIEYFREENPLGSAGAVARLKDRANDCLLVISGDAICDFDLNRVKEEFLKSGCEAGMVLCRTKDSGEYGSVCVHKGKIGAFKYFKTFSYQHLVTAGVLHKIEPARTETPFQYFGSYKTLIRKRAFVKSKAYIGRKLFKKCLSVFYKNVISIIALVKSVCYENKCITA